MKFMSILLICALFVGCSATAEDATVDATVDAAMDEVVASEDTTEGATTQQTNAVEDYYDLTFMSDTMMLAQVYALLSYPDDYEGATFHIAGTYTYYTYPETGTYYFIVINDEAGCCSQGIGIRFPDDIEPPDTFCNVILEGVVSLDVYEEYTIVFLDVTSIERV